MLPQGHNRITPSRTDGQAKLLTHIWVIVHASTDHYNGNVVYMSGCEDHPNNATATAKKKKKRANLIYGYLQYYFN